MKIQRDKDIVDVRAMPLEQIRELCAQEKLRSGRATLEVIEDYIRGKEAGTLIPVRQVIHSYR